MSFNDSEHSPMFQQALKLALNYASSSPNLEDLNQRQWNQAINPDYFVLHWLRYCYKNAQGFKRKDLAPDTPGKQLLVLMANDPELAYLDTILGKTVKTKTKPIDWNTCSIQDAIYNLYHTNETRSTKQLSEKIFGHAVAHQLHLAFSLGVYPKTEWIFQNYTNSNDLDIEGLL